MWEISHLGARDQGQQKGATMFAELGQNRKKCCQGEKIKAANRATRGVLEIKQEKGESAEAVLTSPVLY